MMRITKPLRLTFALLLLSAFAFTTADAQSEQQERTIEPSAATRSRRISEVDSRLTGVYRIDLASSDKLYSVVANASSNLPFAEQQRFFIDLAVRLTPPDLLAIERRGRIITIASSRAPKLTFEADGVTYKERSSNGRTLRTRAVLYGDSLSVSTSGNLEDSFTVTFDPIDNGRRLRVVRRINAAQLNEPVTVQSIYDKISDVAQWNIYGRPEPEANAARASLATETARAGETVKSSTARAESLEAEALRTALNDWVAATNARDIQKLLAFYMSEVKAFYLARHVSRSFIRTERVRDFNTAELLEVRAEEPEIIFSDRGRTAIMRFRKQYATQTRGRKRQGEVIQELRWRRTDEGWRIFSERDVKVLR